MRFTSRIALLMLLACFCLPPGLLQAAERLTLTYIVASNEGADIDLDNDKYRDEMIRLFSYSSYRQLDQQAVQLETQKSETVNIPGGYELILTIKESQPERNTVQAVIRKGGQIYVDTVLTLPKPGVFFLGGPPAEGGALIIVLEMGF